MIITTEAVILNTSKFGDSSKIARLFTRDYGKLSVIAKGARGAKSKFGGVLEPLNILTATIYKKPNRDLHTLSNAETSVSLRKIHSSFDSIAAGFMVLESISQTQDENASNPELYDFLAKTLALINATPDNSFAVFVSFQIYLASQLGVEPDFTDLSANELSNSGKHTIFSIEDGRYGFGSSIKNGNSFRFDNKGFEILKKISTLPIESAKTVQIDNDIKKEIHDFFVRYFSFHLEKRFQYKTFNLMSAQF